MSNYDVLPSDCPHPEGDLRKTQDVNSGLRVVKCRKCGFNFHIIGTHERVAIEGNFLEDAHYRCAACGLQASSPSRFQQVRCDGSDQ